VGGFGLLDKGEALMALVGLPIRSIVPHYMETSNEALPTGWVAAIGQTLNATQQDIVPGGTFVVPDLRNKFILGADITKAIGAAAEAPTGGNINAAAGAPGCQAMGGANGLSITTSEVPIHSHGQTGGSLTIGAATHNHTGATDGVGNHNHGYTATDGAHAHYLERVYSFEGGTPWVNIRTNLPGFHNGVVIAATNVEGHHEHNITTEAAHAHTVDAATMPSHTHTFTVTGGTTGDTGSGDKHENRPLYKALIYIMKVKG